MPFASAETFEPVPQDGRDLLSFFEQGPTESGLTHDERRRYRRTRRLLDGRGRGLWLYYTTPPEARLEGFLPLCVLPVLYPQHELADLAQFVELVRQDVLFGPGTTPERGERIRGLLRECCAYLNHEYQLYLENAARPHNSFEPFVALTRDQLEGIIGVQSDWLDAGKRRAPHLVHPSELVSELLGEIRVFGVKRTSDFELSAFDRIRVAPNGARLLLDRVNDPAAGDPHDQHVVDRLAEVAKGAKSPPRLYTTTLEQQMDAAFAKQPIVEHALDLGLIETRNGNASTTVSEIATSVGLPNSWVRPQLVKRACPGAREKRGKIPVAWLRSDQGRDFVAAAKLEVLRRRRT